MFTKIACAFFSLLLLAPAPAAQVFGGDRGQEGEEEVSEAERELERKALGLLEEVVAEAGGLKLVENRVRVYGVAASLLWPRDADAARALFKQASDGVVELIARADPADPQFQNQLQIVSQLRNELVQLAAPHDAKAALEFVRATRQPAPYVNPDSGYKPPDQEIALEMMLAAQVASQEPKQALRMAEESLERGVSPGLMSVFYQLLSKDREAATRLATEIIRRLRADELARDYEAVNVGLQLLTHTRSDVPAPAPAPAPAEAATPVVQVITESRVSVSFVMDSNAVVVEDRLRKHLIETLVTAALADVPSRYSASSQNILNTLRNSLAEVERYTPARAAAFRRRAAEFERRNDPRGQAFMEYRELLQSGSIEALLEAAPKAPAEVRDQLYTSAAWKAAHENSNFERARQIAESIANPERRAQMLREMEKQIRMLAAQQGNIHDVRQLLARIPSVEEKISTLIQFANSALSRGDKQAAGELLREARTTVGRSQNAQQFYALMSIARAYSTFDERATFEIVEGAIDHLNELIAAAAVVNGFGHDAFREDELRHQGGYMWNDLVRVCAQELAGLADKDFDRARSLTQSFQRADARNMAQLLLAQKILERVSPKKGRIQNLPVNRRTFRSH